MWLRDMRAKHYVEWIYSNDFAEKTKPAIYFISLNGIRYLKTLVWDDDSGDVYPIEELRKRYRESSRSQTFIDRCLLLADCCITLEQQASNNTSYSYVTEADYLVPDNDYHFLAESELINPQLCFVKQEQKNEQDVTSNFLLEIFDATFPRYRVKKRLKGYIEYLDDNEWEGESPQPVILLACARTTDLIYAKRRTRKLLKDIWDDEVPEDIHIRFATIDDIKKHGVIGKIWEEA
jgi:hypothetical protein